MLYLSIGIPGCGKSTLAVDMMDANLLTPEAWVSPDHFRKVLTGSKADQSANSYAFGICKYIVGCRLQRGLDVYFDATNLIGAWRADPLYYAELYSQPVTSILFTANDEECLRRNTARGTDAVPKDVMTLMIQYKHQLSISSLPGKMTTDYDIREKIKWNP